MTGWGFEFASLGRVALPCWDEFPGRLCAYMYVSEICVHKDMSIEKHEPAFTRMHVNISIYIYVYTFVTYVRVYAFIYKYMLIYESRPS